MTTFTKVELIERGFAPSVARAKMLIPFSPALACTAEDYSRLPPEIKALYSAEPVQYSHVSLHSKGS